MFDKFNFGFSRGEIKRPSITAAAAIAEAQAILSEKLRSDYLRVMWQVSQHSTRLGRPFLLETVSSYLAEIRDLGHAPGICNALLAAESLVTNLTKPDSGVYTKDLMAISAARSESISACARRFL